jgi:hypothetical protein
MYRRARWRGISEANVYFRLNVGLPNGCLTRPTVALLFAAALAHSPPQAAVAQQRFQVNDRPVCSCTIRMDSVATLGSLDDPAGFDLKVEVTIDKSGRFYVASTSFDGVFEYDRNGEFTRRIGKRGAGPGEFTGNLFVAIDQFDSLHVVEGRSGRHSVFGPDRRFSRVTPASTRIFGASLERDGSLFTVSPHAEASNGRLTVLARYSHTGQRIAAFDVLETQAPLNGPVRYVTIAPNGEHWSIEASSYTFKHWSPGGRVIAEYRARRSWLTEGPAVRVNPATDRPPAQALGITFDDTGNTVVFWAVPDANWKPSPPAKKIDVAKIYDTVIEVIRPNDGALIAQARVDNITIPFGLGLVYEMLETLEGDRRMRIGRISVTRP